MAGAKPNLNSDQIAPNELRDRLYSIFGRAVLIPVPRGSKKPRRSQWQKITFDQTLADAYQAELLSAIATGGNIGVRLGQLSDCLIAFDWDSNALAEEFLRLNPKFADTTRSRGKKGCQFFARLTGSYPNGQGYYPLKTRDRQNAGEFRVGGGNLGAQSIVYGVHPEGMRYKIENKTPPVTIDFADIQWPSEVVLPWLEKTEGETTSIPAKAVAIVTEQGRFRRPQLEERIRIRLPQTVLDSDFARQLGTHLAPYPFYERNAQCVILEFDAKLRTYRLRAPDAYQFRGDVECIIEPFLVKTLVNKKTGDERLVEIPHSMSAELARSVLVNRALLEQLPPVHSFNTVRLPVERPSGEIELLPEGYDDESCVLTVSSVNASYPLEYSLEQGTDYLRSLTEEFCFHPKDRERSRSVVLASMLTPYCRQLLGAQTQKPGFIYSANSEGAGKTLLVKLAVIPVVGFCPTGTLPKNEDEIRKLIFAAALADDPVLFIDNVSRHLDSGALAAFMTSPNISDRLLGGHQKLTLQHNAVVFVTGNRATFSPDFRRRTLLVELFLEEFRPEDRQIEHPLNDPTILERRAEILAALWALVRSWNESGRPDPAITHKSFPRWAEIIGGILEHAGFASPCTEGISELSGDRNTSDFLELVKTMPPDEPHTSTQLIALCQDNDWLEYYMPEAEEPEAESGEQPPPVPGLFPSEEGHPVDENQSKRVAEPKSKPQQTAAQRSAFGKLLQRFNGRIFTYGDDQGVAHRRRFHIKGRGRAKRFSVEED